jgi:hypothetical protein
MVSLTRQKLRALAAGYGSEIDTVNEHEWCQLLERFDDANIYQTWSYDKVRSGRKNVSRLLLKKNGVTVGIAQARIVKLPLIKAGIAYIRWGPLWRLRDEKADPETFRQAIRALHNEYACRRGLVLRLYPALCHEASSPLSSILGDEGFSLVGRERPDRTLLLDLNRPLPDLRASLRPHWHRYLKVAEKNELEIVEGHDDTLFEMFIGIYREMVARKGFLEPNDINEFRLIQSQLPERFRMKIMLCKSGGEVCAGVICSAMGTTGVYLFGATSNAGLKVRGSYLLHWRLIEWLKQCGFAIYDLNGISPLENPGTYKFKSDLCGKDGKDVFFLGRFDSCTNFLSDSVIGCGDRLRTIWRALRKPAWGSGRSGHQASSPVS